MTPTRPLRRLRPLPVTAGLAAVLAAGALAATAGAAAADSAADAAGSPPASAPAGQTITLPTGDRVVPGHGIVPGGPGRSFVHVHAGGHDYEFPASALSQLGRSLDPSLFDLTALARAEHGSAQVPIQVRGKAATSPARSQRLDAAGQRAFAAALAHGRSPVTDGGSVALAGSAAAPPPATGPQYHTLTVRGIDNTGQPSGDAVAFVINVDDFARLGRSELAPAFFVDGEARIAVPSGHYAATVMYPETDADGTQTAMREVTDPEFTVSGDRSITLDARSATSRVAVDTPRPSAPQVSGFALDRRDTKNRSFYVDTFADGGAPLYVEPVTTPVTVGTLRDYAYQRLTSPPATAGLPYEYNLLEPISTSIIPEQHYTQTAAGLATVDARYYSDVRTVGTLQKTGIRPFEVGAFVLRPDDALALPTERTEYLTAGDVLWYGALAKFTDNDTGAGGEFFDVQYSAVHTYRPGESVREDTNRYPLHTRGENNFANPARFYATAPGATRQGDTVAFALYPFSDNLPLDTSGGLSSAPDETQRATYTFAVDGTPVDSRAVRFGPVGGVEKVPADPATLSLTVDSHARGPRHVLSTDVTTTWTWRSTHQSTGTLPPGSACADAFATRGSASSSKPTRDCRVEPLLSTLYDVQGERLDGSTPYGTQHVGISVDHLQYAAQPTVTGASAQYSLDAGRTWRPATVTGTGGHYDAAFAVSGKSGSSRFVDLRVSATDADGGTFTETIARAFAAHD